MFFGVHMPDNVAADDGDHDGGDDEDDNDDDDDDDDDEEEEEDNENDKGNENDTDYEHDKKNGKHVKDHDYDGEDAWPTHGRASKLTSWFWLIIRGNQWFS